MVKALPHQLFICNVLCALLALTYGNPPPSMLSHKSKVMPRIQACGSDLTKKLFLECARHQNKAGKRNYENFRGPQNLLESTARQTIFSTDYSNEGMNEYQDLNILLQNMNLSKGEENTSKDMDHLIQYYSSPRYIRLRRSYNMSRGGGLATECCENVCTLKTLLDYCP
ncbi:hypothetical protein WDU94_014686 [Cyamophila willieti]